MIYELRTYTAKPGSAAIMAQNAATVGREIRGNAYGRLEGYWLTEIGPLNQTLHLWRYADLNERMEKRAALARNARWKAEYQPLSRGHLIRQDIRLMTAIIDPIPPERDGNIYELRTCRLQPGTVRTWCDMFAAALGLREKYSKIVGLWLTGAGQPNEVCHIWAYSDLNARAATRARVAADPEWQGFVAKARPLIEEMWSTVMLPFDHSPLK